MKCVLTCFLIRKKQKKIKVVLEKFVYDIMFQYRLNLFFQPIRFCYNYITVFGSRCAFRQLMFPNWCLSQLLICYNGQDGNFHPSTKRWCNILLSFSVKDLGFNWERCNFSNWMLGALRIYFRLGELTRFQRIFSTMGIISQLIVYRFLCVSWRKCNQVQWW